MFHSARLRLTGWYVFIIMLVSIFFSVTIYQILSHEVEKSLNRQRGRFMAGDTVFVAPLPAVEQELLAEAKQDIERRLLVLNLIIFAGSGVASYLLAGRTLKPIAEMLEEQNRFTADASHELRTPLTAMKTEIEVALRDKALSEQESKELLKSNLEEVDKLRLLANNLLTLAHHKNGNGKPFEPVSLAEVINQAWKRVATLAKTKNISIVKPESDITLDGDEVSLLELFVILLDNAIKYGKPESKITLHWHPKNDQAVIEVVNEGNGISAEDLPNIFKRFYRADVSRTKGESAGYGLGLSIAKKIVENHHGSISAASTPKKETVFTMRLPLKKKLA